MDPILVPAPPRSAYNHNRRVSDLLLKQLEHFQHVEMKSGDLGIDPEIARNIHTEIGAASYIAAVTTALRSKGPSASPVLPPLTVVPKTKSPKKVPNPAPLAIAAAAGKAAPPKKTANIKAASTKPATTTPKRKT